MVCTGSQNPMGEQRLAAIKLPDSWKSQIDPLCSGNPTVSQYCSVSEMAIQVEIIYPHNLLENIDVLLDTPAHAMMRTTLST
jgi:hypothetical protein